MSRGDDGDFAAFVHATGTQLHRTALLLTGGDHHLAEDLLQTTYTKVYGRWSRVLKADNPVGYARTILLNTFLSHRRLRRSTERPGLAADLTESLAVTPVTDADPSTRIDLLAALARLSPTDRAVLVARYWEDRSISQTADDLHISEAAVRTRSKRALERLRPLLHDSFPERIQ